MVVLDERSGSAGCGEARSGFHPALIEPIVHGQARVGQIRVGRCRRGGYSREQVAKLHHYGSLFGRIHAFAVRARQWRALAMTDDLTGLPNRRHLLRYLSEKIEIARRDGKTVTALVFDIDDFKRYNDTYGHDAGDQILVEVGQLFVQCSRKTDMVSRYGGDEFVVVFWDPEGPRSSGSRHPEAVIEVVSRFRQALREHRFSRLGPEAQGRLTISGGLAHFPYQATQAEPLIAAADQALMKAKEAGKNRFWVTGAGAVESANCV
jgi:diguanylate cyclase (GGDEF)-like protein